MESPLEWPFQNERSAVIHMFVHSMPIGIPDPDPDWLNPDEMGLGHETRQMSSDTLFFLQVCQQRQHERTLFL